MWVNINFERRDLTSTQKSHPSLDDIGEIFAVNLIKNVTHFFHLFNAKRFAVSLKNLNLNYYCQVLQVSPHRINGGLSDKGCSSVPPPLPPCSSLWLFPSLICSPTKEPYLKVDNFMMYRYRNVAFTSKFYYNRNTKKKKVALSKERDEWIRLLNKLRWLKI